MANSHSTATPEATKTSTITHPPVPDVQKASEPEIDRSEMLGTRAIQAIGGGSPETSPEQYAGALGQLSGRSQTVLWRQMQRGYGNNYVGRVIQAKLTVNQPGDIYEQEADRMAAQVMAMPQSDRSIQREMDPKKEKEKIQMKPSLQLAPDRNREAGGNLEDRLNGNKGGGSPLPDDVRSFMEPRFGADFSQVRVHTGSESVQMNQELNAQAFTHRQDVYFGAGKAPAKDSLTAHELTHVVQQTGNVQKQVFPDQRTVQHNCAVCEEEEKPVHQSNYFQQPGTEFVQAQPQMNSVPVPLPLDHEERKVQIEELKHSVQSRREQRDNLKAELDSLPKISGKDEEETQATLERDKILKDEIIAAEDYLIKGLDDEISTIDQALENIYRILPNQSGKGAPEVSPEVWAEITRLEAEKKAAEQERLKISRGRARNEIRAIEERLRQVPMVSKESEELEKRKKELGKFLSSTADPKKRTSPGNFGEDSRGRAYVVYQDEVKVGGKLPWLNNNPGNLDAMEQASGVIGFKRHTIFKDWESGVSAAGAWWDERKKESPGLKISAAIERYKMSPDDLPEYKKDVALFSQLDLSRTLGNLKNDDKNKELADLKQAILRREGGLSAINVGETYRCDDTDTAPLKHRSLLGCDD